MKSSFSEENKVARESLGKSSLAGSTLHTANIIIVDGACQRRSCPVILQLQHRHTHRMASEKFIYYLLETAYPIEQCLHIVYFYSFFSQPFVLVKKFYVKRISVYYHKIIRKKHKKGFIKLSFVLVFWIGMCFNCILLCFKYY